MKPKCTKCFQRLTQLARQRVFGGVAKESQPIARGELQMVPCSCALAIASQKLQVGSSVDYARDSAGDNPEGKWSVREIRNAMRILVIFLTGDARSVEHMGLVRSNVRPE